MNKHGIIKDINNVNQFKQFFENSPTRNINTNTSPTTKTEEPSGEHNSGGEKKKISDKKEERKHKHQVDRQQQALPQEGI